MSTPRCLSLALATDLPQPAAAETSLATRRGASRGLALALLALSLALFAGGCSQNLLTFLADSPEIGYSSTCRRIADGHQGDVAAGRYFLPLVDVDRWPGGAKPENANERHLIDALVSGKSRFALVEARGGLGKTRLAQSIHAQTCHRLPVFTVDLNAEVAAAGDVGGGNPILRVMAKQLGLKGDVAGQQRLDELLHSHSWVLLADAIEEVELLQRPKVSIALAKLRQAYPKTAQVVLLARPAVLVPNYGFDDVDTVVRIRLVDCERADKVITNMNGKPEQLSAFKTFTSRHGFDVQRRSDGQCIYPFMATYRDISELKRLAAKTDESIDSVAAAHEALVALRLTKELDRMNWGQREALDMLDRMVKFQRQSQGTGAPVFDVIQCMKSIDPEHGWTAVDAGVTGSNEQRRRQVCEKTLQSVIFEKQGTGFAEEGRWAFFDLRTAALFRARWLNGELSRGAAGDCKPVTAHADLVSDAEVVRFLGGQPLVQRCFGQVLSVLCAKGGDKPVAMQALIEGLPAPSKRFQMVEEGRAFAVENGRPACVTSALDEVARSMGQQ